MDRLVTVRFLVRGEVGQGSNIVHWLSIWDSGEWILNQAPWGFLAALWLAASCSLLTLDSSSACSLSYKTFANHSMMDSVLFPWAHNTWCSCPENYFTWMLSPLDCERLEGQGSGYSSYLQNCSSRRILLPIDWLKCVRCLYLSSVILDQWFLPWELHMLKIKNSWLD